jgi:hypothetical protein
LTATSPDEAITRDVCLGKIEGEEQQDAFLCGRCDQLEIAFSLV